MIIGSGSAHRCVILSSSSRRGTLPSTNGNVRAASYRVSIHKIVNPSPAPRAQDERYTLFRFAVIASQAVNGLTDRKRLMFQPCGTAHTMFGSASVQHIKTNSCDTIQRG